MTYLKWSELVFKHLDKIDPEIEIRPDAMKSLYESGYKPKQSAKMLAI